VNQVKVDKQFSHKWKRSYSHGQSTASVESWDCENKVNAHIKPEVTVSI